MSINPSSSIIDKLDMKFKEMPSHSLSSMGNDSKSLTISTFILLVSKLCWNTFLHISPHFRPIWDPLHES